MRTWLSSVACAFLLTLPALAVWSAEDPTTADRAYRAKDWVAAERAYATLAKEAPQNPLYTFRQGACLVGLGRGAEALAFFDAAAALGFPPPLMQAWSARALARTGQRDRALEILQKATTAGFAQVAMLDGEADFAPLRDDPRFAAARAAADRNARPCTYGPEYRQLDFWVGDWDVTASGAPAGQSHVEKMLGDCVIFENWTGASGVTGKSFNIWDSTTNQWRQTWVDSAGTLFEFHGELKDGNMYYRAEGLQPGPDGKLVKTLQKMTFFDQGGTVRQLGEQSIDDGKTWSVGYDLLYTSKAAK